MDNENDAPAIDAEDPKGVVATERAKVVIALRTFANRLEAAPTNGLVHTLPIVARAVEGRSSVSV